MKIVNILKRTCRFSLLLMIIALALVVFTDSSFEEEVVNSATTETITLKLEAINGTGREAYPEVKVSGSTYTCEKSVKLKITLSKAATKNIVVKYRTYDMSAVALDSKGKQKDYAQVTNGSVEIATGSTSKNLSSITVATDTYCVSLDGVKTKGWQSKYFCVELLSVDQEGYEISSTEGTINCHLAYSYLYKALLKDGSYILEGNVPTVKTRKIYYDTEHTHGGVWSTPQEEYLNITIPYPCVDGAQYVGKLNNIYYGVSFRAVDYSIAQEDLDFYIQSGYKGTNVAHVELDGYLGRLAFFDIKPDYWDDIDLRLAGSKDCVTAYSYKNRDYETSDFRTTATSIGNVPYVTIKDNSKDYKYYAVNDANNVYLYEEDWNPTNYTRGFTHVTSYCVPYDGIAPKIKNFSCQSQVYGNSNKYYMAIEFTEPVQVLNTKDLKLKCNANNATGIDNPFEFTYHSGSGSSTLVFELDLNTTSLKVRINKFYPYAFVYDTTKATSGIFDLGGTTTVHNKLGDTFSMSGTTINKTHNTYTNYATFRNNDVYRNTGELVVSIDTRIPSIKDLTATTGKNKTVTINVTVSNFLSSATSESAQSAVGSFYYAWSNDVTNSDKITMESSYTKISPNGSGEFVIKNASELTGTRFLWLKAVSHIGKTDVKVAGPYYFDNEANEAINIQFEESADSPRQVKHFTFDIDLSKCYYSATDLQYVDVVWTDQTVSIWNDKTEYHYNGNSTKLSSITHFWASTQANTRVQKVDAKTETITKKEMTFATVSATSNEVAKSTFESTTSKTYVTKLTYRCEVEYQFVGIGENDFKKFYIGFRLTDKNGNVTNHSYERSKDICYMDTRNILEGDWVIGTNTVAEITEDDFTAYNVKNFELDLNLKSVIEDAQDSKFIIKKKGVQLLQGEIGEIFKITKSLKNNYTSYNIKFIDETKDLAGYYTFELWVAKTPIDDKDRTTVAFECFIVNKDSSGKFTNATSNLTNMKKFEVLKNKIYSISTEARFSYKTADSKLVNEKYSSNSPLAFSTMSLAREYLKYMEYQDMYLIQIGEQSFADNLNGNTSEIYKATADSNIVATVGQYWIRYKRSTWLQGSTSSAWCYYYYGEAEDSKTAIDVTALPGSLENAIDAVVDGIITTFGSTIYLNNLEGLDKYGVPYLDETAIKSTSVSLSSTKAGTLLSPLIVFGGDPAIYQSYVETALGKYKMASTFEFTYPTLGALYYAEYNGSYIPMENFKRVTTEDNLLAKTLVEKSGVYRFIEVSIDGAQTYDVYIDAAAPSLSFTYYQYDENRVIQEKEALTTSDFKKYSYYGTSATIKSITNEIDDLAYITLFYRGSGNLFKCLTKEELANEEIVLENNQYVVYVYDRSGNSYTIEMYFNDTELKCTITDNPNSSLSFRVYNREAKDIYRYEVYLNEKILTSSFEELNRFSQSGDYRFYVEDFYGNVYEQTYTFTRQTPELTWKYETETGYGTYKEGLLSNMTLTSTGSQEFLITTSSRLAVTYEQTYDLKFEIIEGTVTFNDSSFMGNSIIYFNELVDFQLKVSYTKYPDIYAIYTIKVDNQAPNIRAVYDEYVIVNHEDLDLYNQIEDAIGMKDGTELQPTMIGYGAGRVSQKMITNNKIITSNAIHLSFEDDSGIYQIKVTVNGLVLISTKNVEDTYEFNEYGKYVIEVYDNLNNKAILTFTNNQTSSYSYSIDGKTQVTPISCKDYFTIYEDHADYNKIEYGNSNAIFKVPFDTRIFILLKSDEYTSMFIGFNYENGVLAERKYRAKYNYDEVQYDDYGTIIANYVIESEEYLGNEVFKLNDSFKANQWYQIKSFTEDGLDIYAMIDDNNQLFLKVLSSNYEDDIFDIEVKIQSKDNTEPFFAKVKLSKKQSDIYLENQNGAVETNHDGDIIYTNGTIAIGRDDFDNYVTSIVGSYSETNRFDEAGTNIYLNGEFKPYVIEKEGFYRFVIKNVFGNQTIYTIALSNNCLIISEMIYFDKTSTNYTSAYENEYLYSNYQAIIEVFSEGIVYSVYKDGAKYIPQIVSSEKYLKIILEGDGYYTVHINDKYANHYEKYVEIEYRVVSISDDLIEGYNELALLKDEGYTNRKLSINQNQLEMSSFEYIYVYKENEVNNVVYDLISENKVVLDPLQLVECIGNSGDGTYKIECRDKFGNVATKEIFYRETPTLTIKRQTRVETASTAYDIEVALDEGVYSSNIVSLLSISQCYNFTIDGVKNTLPSTLQFANNTLDEGTRDFNIYYLDEYGFEYEFVVHLVRKNISFDEPLFEIIRYNEKQYTKDNVSLTFASDLSCSYVIGDSESIPYESGYALTDDGSYRFALSDIAGNVCYFYVTKDTIVEYAFVGNSTKQEYENSSAITKEKVSFQAKNGDTAYIAQVFLDGNEISTDSSTFSSDGKWEILVCDKIGNYSVYRMYIITHEMNHFDYTCPKNYIISDFRYDNGNGQAVDYLSKISDDSTSFSVDEDGIYGVVLMSQITKEVTRFTFTISTKAPEAALDGVVNGESTINDIRLKNTKTGDTIYVYKDGKLLNTYNVETDGGTPVISEKGSYKLVVENLAGNVVEYNFVRKYVANTAGSVLIITVFVLLSVGLFIGVIYRNRTRVDK